MIDYSKIDLENTINSGQVFLWKKFQNDWYGIDGQNVLRLTKSCKIKTYTKPKTDFFREKDDIKKIIQSICKDKTVKLAVEEFFLFPEPKVLASASLEDIKSCGAGYRSKHIIEASKMVVSNDINFEYLKKCDYVTARKNLCKVPGIGNKVADCILLFSLEKLEAFPLDRWMIRILEKYYPSIFELHTKRITDKQYNILHEKARKYFGPYAGFAQQFLFKMERENYQKRWL